MPEKKKIAPSTPEKIISLIFLSPVPPSIKLKPAYINPAIPSSDNIIPSTRFSIIFYLQGSAKKRLVPESKLISVIYVTNSKNYINKKQKTGNTSGHHCTKVKRVMANLKGYLSLHLFKAS